MSRSNEPDQSAARELIALPDALRELPQLRPPAGAWAELSASLAQGPRLVAARKAAIRRPASRRRAWHRQLPRALAAGIAVALITVSILYAVRPHRRDTEATPAVVAAATKSAATASSMNNAAKGTSTQMESNAEQLAILEAHSRELEGWLRDTSKASAPQSAQDLAASAEIQDMIGLVDVQLEAAEGPSAVSLWRRRVALLEDLSTLRYSSNVTRFETGIAQLDPAVIGAGAPETSWKN